VGGNQLHGSVPASVANWVALTIFNVNDNQFSGGMLPVLPFENLQQCGLLDQTIDPRGHNKFLCPWPEGATKKCHKEQKPGWINITDSDCTLCEGSSTDLPADQCIAWRNLYESTGGDNWTTRQKCTKYDPCGCMGQTPVCNKIFTTMIAMCVPPPPHTHTPPVPPLALRPPSPPFLTFCSLFPLVPPPVTCVPRT
jgi:hypothetical protein